MGNIVKGFLDLFKPKDALPKYNKDQSKQKTLTRSRKDRFTPCPDKIKTPTLGVGMSAKEAVEAMYRTASLGKEHIMPLNSFAKGGIVPKEIPMDGEAILNYKGYTMRGRITNVQMDRDIIDVTSLDSTGGYREFITGYRKMTAEIEIEGKITKLSEDETD